MLPWCWDVHTSLPKLLKQLEGTPGLAKLGLKNWRLRDEEIKSLGRYTQREPRGQGLTLRRLSWAFNVSPQEAEAAGSLPFL